MWQLTACIAGGSLGLLFTQCATPADWQRGQDVVVLPNISNEDAAKMFPKGFKEVKPYLRTTADPGAE